MGNLFERYPRPWAIVGGQLVDASRREIPHFAAMEFLAMVANNLPDDSFGEDEDQLNADAAAHGQMADWEARKRNGS